MLTMLALLFAAPQDPETLRQMIASRCAMPADRLVIEQWTDQAIEILVVRGDDPLTDAQHICLDAVMSRASFDEDGINFTFGNDELRMRHDEVIRRERVAAARRELASRGLLRRLPVYRPTRDDPAVFAKRLERLCGAAPGSLLEVEDNGNGNIMLIIDSDEKISEGKFQLQSCAISALIATGFEPWGALPPPVFYATTAGSENR